MRPWILLQSHCYAHLSLFFLLQKWFRGHRCPLFPARRVLPGMLSRSHKLRQVPADLLRCQRWMMSSKSHPTYQQKKSLKTMQIPRLRLTPVARSLRNGVAVNAAEHFHLTHTNLAPKPGAWFFCAMDFGAKGSVAGKINRSLLMLSISFPSGNWNSTAGSRWP